MRRLAAKAQGVALVTALVIATVFFVLASAFFVHMKEDFAAHRQRQWAVQAEWNARAGIEYYYLRRALPEPEPKTGLRVYNIDEESSLNRCIVHQDPRGLRFEGVCRGVSRSLILVEGGRGRLLKVLE